MDRFAARFSGAIRMQGHRVEIISELEVLAERMLKQFFSSTGGTMRVELIGHFKPCITEIYLHI